MLVLLPGKLYIDNSNYLRVDVTDELHPLIIWSYGYSYKVKNSAIIIINEQGQETIKVGDIVELGGGFVGASVVKDKIGQKLPEDAIGPYFLSNPQ